MRDPGTIGFTEVEGRTFDADWRQHSTLRDYSGIAYGLTGGHRDDALVHHSRHGLEAGYMEFARPDDAHDQRPRTRR